MAHCLCDALTRTVAASVFSRIDSSLRWCPTHFAPQKGLDAGGAPIAPTNRCVSRTKLSSPRARSELDARAARKPRKSRQRGAMVPRQHAKREVAVACPVQCARFAPIPDQTRNACADVLFVRRSTVARRPARAYCKSTAMLRLIGDGSSSSPTIVRRLDFRRLKLPEAVHYERAVELPHTRIIQSGWPLMSIVLPPSRS